MNEINLKCPACGKKGGLVKKGLDDLKQKGKLRKELFPDGIAIPFPLLDPVRPPVLLTAKTVSVPVMYIYIEVCSNNKCGCIYCTKFELKVQQFPVQYE